MEPKKYRVRVRMTDPRTGERRRSKAYLSRDARRCARDAKEYGREARRRIAEEASQARGLRPYVAGEPQGDDQAVDGEEV